MNMFLLLLLICLSGGYSNAVKVIVLPQNMNSHIIYHTRIAQLLANEGHVVDIILPSCVKIPDLIKGSDVRVLRYDVKTNVSFVNSERASQMLSDSLMAKSFFQEIRMKIDFMKTMMKHWDEECVHLLTDASIRRHMADMKYDVAVADPVTMKCHVALLYEMDIPIVLLGIIPMDWILRVPALPSFMPSLLSTLGDSMSFFERFQNTVVSLISHVAFVLMTTDTLPMIDPPVPVMDIFQRWQLYLLLDDISVSYPRPMMPNIIPIGDAIPQPGKPLEQHLEQFVQSAQHGVIVVSFGSYFHYLPSDIILKLCSAFKNVDQNVIWKLKNDALCDVDPSKVLIQDWLPQNDLLSHDNVRLFISHCGMNSILESIYHSTPIIGFPTSIDQPQNARRLVNLGLGYQMDIRHFTADDLVDKISKIISDETILRNVRRASEIMKNKPESPQKRLSYWVEHIVKYGAEHLRTKAFQLNTFQFYCFDVLLVLLLITAVVTIAFLCCLKYAFRLVTRSLGNKQKVD